MKGITAFVIALILLFSLAACVQSEKKNNADDRRISIVSTIFVPYDFARQIAGDKAEITMLLPPGSESHSYEPTPQDIIKIKDCDLFIYVGGESDTWVHEVLSSMEDSHLKTLTLMDCVPTVEEELSHGMEDGFNHEYYTMAGEDDHEHEEEEALDEHVWTSPKNAKQIVEKISDSLCEVDSENSEFFMQNEDAYLKKLDELDASFQAVIDGAARKTIVFGDRFPFIYLTEAYGLKYYAAFPGCSTETEPSAATITFIIDIIKAEKIPVVFHTEMSGQKIANTLSEASGAKVLLLHSCHNVSKDEMTSGVTYLELMKNNAENLKEALS